MALSDKMSDKKTEPPHQNKGPREKPMTKVVIRRLPPSMDQETFLNQIAPVPSYDYFYMVRGDASLREHSFARAYINFVHHEDIYDFKEKFDNYVFVDGAGHEYPAVVEFAPFQKIPKRRNKPRMDPKSGTVESDPSYLEFVEMLNKPPEQEEKPEYSYQINTESKNSETTTPLLEYIKVRRAEKMRMREERREERKRKEFERKKYREDDRRKIDEKSPKNYKNQHSNKNQILKDNSQETETSKSEETKPKTDEKKEDQEVKKIETKEKTDRNPPSSSYYNKGGRDKKYEDRRKENKNKYQPTKRDYTEKREYKNQRRDEFNKDRKYDENSKKDDPKVFQNKKVKKYSEKREERKVEAQKAEQKKMDQETGEQSTKPNLTGETSAKKNEEKEKTKDAATGDVPKSNENKHRDNDSKRIRNKDRPTIAIYRPGMLSKKKHSDGDSETKERKE